MKITSKETIARLPSYLRFLKELDKNGTKNVSSTTIAERLNLSGISVRKDLAAISVNGGRPKLGFYVQELIAEISTFLGYNNAKDAILVGVGKLGSALLGYEGFDNYGLNIVACFDIDTDIKLTNKTVYHINKMQQMIKDMGISIGIITTPSQNAQNICDLMVEAGIKAIWNFSPANLVVPENIAVKQEDMAASLALLSQKLLEIIVKEQI